MKYTDFLGNENEKPLDIIRDDGGFTSIFRTIGVIGDSLASGEFEATDEQGNIQYHDFYEYSWGQFLARAAKVKVYNFSRGGMTAKEYYESYANKNHCWIPCQAYIICLGNNDLFVNGYDLGSANDVYPENSEMNKDNFIGYMGKILSKLRNIAPSSKIFVISMQHDDLGEERNRIIDCCSQELENLVKKYSSCYFMDFSKYSVVYNEEVRRSFSLGFHPNPMGYYIYAKMVGSYIDYIIRHNMEEFAQTAFIGTEFKFK